MFWSLDHPTHPADVSAPSLRFAQRLTFAISQARLISATDTFLTRFFFFEKHEPVGSAAPTTRKLGGTNARVIFPRQHYACNRPGTAWP